MGDQKLTVLYPAYTLNEAETMRQVRNTCREFMTGAQREITIEDQERWFKLIDRQWIKPYVFCRLAPSMQIGFGLIRYDRKKWWLSGGLLPEWRDKGYGRHLFNGLANIVNMELSADCWLAVFKDNVRAIKTYQSIGFVDEGGYGPPERPILTMYRSRSRQ
jgi:GNAT superfamily N-acetyltransferase